MILSKDNHWILVRHHSTSHNRHLLEIWHKHKENDEWFWPAPDAFCHRCEEVIPSTGPLSQRTLSRFIDPIQIWPRSGEFIVQYNPQSDTFRAYDDDEDKSLDNHFTEPPILSGALGYIISEGVRVEFEGNIAKICLS